MMVLLCYEAQVEARFFPFRDSANLDVRGARFAPNVPYTRKSFWMHPMELLGDVGHDESCFGPFGDSVNLDAR
jgi:hypothetical protein